MTSRASLMYKIVFGLSSTDHMSWSSTYLQCYLHCLIKDIASNNIDVVLWRHQAFETDVYTTSETAFSNMSIVPETLKTFTYDVINKRKKGNVVAKTRKCTVINHAIIAATRLRSFLSIIQIGLSVYIHRHLASWHNMIDVLSSMGVCASYSEARQMY